MSCKKGKKNPWARGAERSGRGPDPHRPGVQGTDPHLSSKNIAAAAKNAIGKIEEREKGGKDK